MQTPRARPAHFAGIMKTPPQKTAGRTAKGERAPVPPATSRSRTVAASPPRAGCSGSPARPPRAPGPTTIPSLRIHDVAGVGIAGAFNDRKPEPLTRDESGAWSISLRLALGDYEYLFVVEGRWLPDPACAETLPNPYGGLNSVLRVPGPDRSKQGAE